MNLKLINRGNEGEVLMAGRLDTNTAPETETMLSELTDRFDTLILDMTGLDYVSSAGLRVLKIVHVKMKKKEGKLLLRNVKPMIMEVFEMTGFAGLLNIE